MLMKTQKSKGILIGGAIFFLFASAVLAQAPAGQNPAKAYEKYLGRYEFDLSAMGGGVKIFEFYVKDGAFWIEYGYTAPGELKPVADVPDAFSFLDPDDGLAKLTFQKDAAGQYTKVRLIAEALGLDVVGTKQK